MTKSIAGLLLIAVALPTIGANITPSNLPASFCDDVIVGDLMVATGTILTIDTATNCDLVRPQAGGPELCVVRRNNVTVAAGGLIRALGNRALALTAQQNFELRGAIDAAALGSTPGPGTVLLGNGVASLGASAGAGGAGHRDAGGRGGDYSAQFQIGGAGGPSFAAGSFVPLLGGSAGATSVNAAGGGGGGALQLVACQQFFFGPAGSISGGGGGGRGGQGVASPALPGGGAGGGSGGTLLIEGDSVSMFGVVCANGGAGGEGGARSTGVPGPGGEQGSDALCSTAPAAGGSAGNVSGGNGGNGGAASFLANPGQNASSGNGGGGGGGGAAGAIGIRSCASRDLSGALLSPAPDLGSSCTPDIIFANGFET